MSYIRCEDCGFMYECVNYAPCSACALLAKIEEEEDDESEQLEFFFDGEYTFEMKKVA